MIVWPHLTYSIIQEYFQSLGVLDGLSAHDIESFGPCDEANSVDANESVASQSLFGKQDSDRARRSSAAAGAFSVHPHTSERDSIANQVKRRRQSTAIEAIAFSSFSVAHDSDRAGEDDSVASQVRGRYLGTVSSSWCDVGIVSAVLDSFIQLLYIFILMRCQSRPAMEILRKTRAVLHHKILYIQKDGSPRLLNLNRALAKIKPIGCHLFFE